MDSNTDSHYLLAANGTDDVEAGSSQTREIEMSIKLITQDRVRFTAVYDPNSRCSTMPKEFLEHIKCLHRMKSKTATHSFNSRPHQCVGIFEYFIRFVGIPGETYWVPFCIVENAEHAMSPIYIGRETKPPLFPGGLSASESRQDYEKPMRPILAGGVDKEDPKVKADKLLKREKEDDDHKKKENEHKRQKRGKGKKEGESQSGKDGEKQTK